MRPPSSDREDEKDRIAPEAERPRIGVRQEAELNSFEDMSEYGRELQASDPQGPKATRLKGDAYEDRQHAEVDQEDTDLDAGISAENRSHDEQLDDRRDQAGSCRDALIAVTAPERERADQQQDRPVDGVRKHGGSDRTTSLWSGQTTLGDDAQFAEALRRRAIVGIAEPDRAQAGDLALGTRELLMAADD